MNAKDFYQNVKQMREAQKRYFATPKENRDAKQQALRESKHYESVVDTAIQEAEAKLASMNQQEGGSK